MIKKIKIKKYYTGKYDYRRKAYYTDIAKIDTQQKGRRPDLSAFCLDKT